MAFETATTSIASTYIHRINGTDRDDSIDKDVDFAIKKTIKILENYPK